MTVAEEPDKYRAPALDNGLDIIELLASAGEEMSQVEIGHRARPYPNEVYRMLDRLVRPNYIRRFSADRYELTLKLFELAHARPPTQRLISQALLLMYRFAREAVQACHLVVRDRNILLVLVQVDGPGSWNLSIRVGSLIGLFNSGSGHVFLAYASSEDRGLMEEEEKVTGQDEGFDAELERRLADVRRQGFVIMPSLQNPGITDLSVPVFGPIGVGRAFLPLHTAPRPPVGGRRAGRDPHAPHSQRGDHVAPRSGRGWLPGGHDATLRDGDRGEAGGDRRV